MDNRGVMKTNALQKDVPLERVNEEIIDPRDYLKLSESDRAKIETSQIIPPRLGDGTFGKIKIRYQSPIYRLRTA